jgi:hypothetical protein
LRYHPEKSNEPRDWRKRHVSERRHAVPEVLTNDKRRVDIYDTRDTLYSSYEYTLNLYGIPVSVTGQRQK